MDPTGDSVALSQTLDPVDSDLPPERNKPVIEQWHIGGIETSTHVDHSLHCSGSCPHPGGGYQERMAWPHTVVPVVAVRLASVVIVDRSLLIGSGC